MILLCPACGETTEEPRLSPQGKVVECPHCDRAYEILGTYRDQYLVRRCGVAKTVRERIEAKNKTVSRASTAKMLRLWPGLLDLLRDAETCLGSLDSAKHPVCANTGARIKMLLKEVKDV